MCGELSAEPTSARFDSTSILLIRLSSFCSSPLHLSFYSLACACYSYGEWLRLCVPDWLIGVGFAFVCLALFKNSRPTSRHSTSPGEIRHQWQHTPKNIRQMRILVIFHVVVGLVWFGLHSNLVVGIWMKGRWVDGIRLHSRPRHNSHQHANTQDYIRSVK